MDDITTIDDLPKNFSFASRAEYRRVKDLTVLHAVFRASGEHHLRPTKAVKGQSWEFALPHTVVDTLLDNHPLSPQLKLAGSYLRTAISVAKSEQIWQTPATTLKAGPK